MRTALVVTAVLVCMLLGGTCIPLIDNTRRSPEAGHDLVITITAPTAATSVPAGDDVRIAWSAGNTTGKTAHITVLVESRRDLSLTMLLADRVVTGTGDTSEYLWNTTGFSGPYSVIVRIRTDSASDESKSTGLVTVVPAPTFVFTAPATNQDFDPNGSPVLPVTISWSGQGTNATARIALDPDLDHGDPAGDPNDADRNEIIIGVEDLPETTATGTLEWKGKNSSNQNVAAGTYYLFAIVQDDVNADQFVDGLAQITVLGPPTPVTFSFTAPTTSQEYDFRDPNAITISWSGYGSDSATVKIALDPDSSHGDPTADPNDASRNEIIIHEANLPQTQETGTFDWEGKDSDDQNLAAGNYYLFAIVDNDVNDARFVNSSARITVSPALAVTDPNTDTSFFGAGTVQIKYHVHQSESVLVDLKIDTDDNHQNGNERTILSQVVVDPNTAATTPFDWDGNDSDGNPVPDTIYRVFATSSTGTGTPQIAEANGLVQRRTATATQPLVALLAPNTVQTVTPGQFVTIRWRDDDPDETADVTIVIHDSSTLPANPGAATAIILPWRPAKDDGVQDTFTWQVPASLAFDTYYVFAYIDADQAAPWDNTSVAGGQIILKDPSQ